MNRHLQIYLIAAIAVAGTLGISAYALENTMEEESEKVKCAHGRNNFDCNPPTFRTDIEALDKRVTELEKRVFSP